ncbi:F-box protein At4g00893-like [Vigna unguiculata]|uniref:F-box protein At4g00893-like n=1 Tax=Vigna unguiculata TaxID=3917 RepID=UPI001015D128|nr:F-box protein At4g00893-like [Vigna unguiculata]
MSGKWSDLPGDLLSKIANGLGLIDFLSFRCVCKDWNTASLKVSPYDKSVLCDPWFLMYGREGSKCSLLSHQNKCYSINLPEIDGATCLASYQGWLLLFGQGSLFFFSPFSRAKIDLPNCPLTDACDHVAAFSAAPTSEECIVVVLNCTIPTELQLFKLCKGKDEWAKSSFSGHEFRKIETALFYEKKEFHFLDGDNGLITFNASKKSKQWNMYTLSVSTGKSPSSTRLRYTTRKNIFQLKNEQREKGLLEANDSISTCGTIVPHSSGLCDMIIRSESIEAKTQPQSRHLKGVWIQPRYFPVPSTQTW